MPVRYRKPTTRPRKTPVQERSRVTVDVILEAVARILTREGPNAVSTNRIAEVAGVSVGSVYQYFPNKNAIVDALVERKVEDVLAILEGCPPVDGSTTLAELVRERVTIMVRIACDRAALPPWTGTFVQSLPARAILAENVLREQFRRMIEARRKDVVVADPEIAAAFCAAAARGILRAVREARISTPAEALTSELTALLVRYLTGRSP